MDLLPIFIFYQFFRIIPKANDGLDEIMIRELYVCFFSVLKADLFVKYEAWIGPTTLDEFLETQLILANGHGSAPHGLTLLPEITKRELEIPFLASAVEALSKLLIVALVRGNGVLCLTWVFRNKTANQADTSSNSCDSYRLDKDDVANIFALSVHTFPFGAVTRPVHPVRLQSKDLGCRISL